MGTATGAYSARTNHQLRVETQLVSQNIAGNYSTINFQIYSEKTAASTSYYLTAGGGGSFNIGGNTGALPAWLYDFRSNTSYTRATGTVNVGHNADGTLTYGFSASDTAPGALGSASASGSETLPTIARATQPTVSPTSGNTDSTYGIGTAAADSSFTHNIYCSMDNGASYFALITGQAGTVTNYNWTPASTLLPNLTSMTAIIAVNTYTSGGAYIGQKLVYLPLSVPSSIVPTISAVSWVDTQTAAPDVPTLMGGAGRYVQAWSKLQPTVASAGAAGSTISSSSVTQNGQVAASGASFATAVNLSGAVPFTAVAADSRGRTSAVYASTVAVTAYNFPILPTPIITRTSDAAGAVPSSTGTYLSITPSASVSSLVFGAVEKNLLEWQIRIKPVGGTYTTVAAWSATNVSGNTWTTKYVAAGYASATEWVVEVSVRDLFGKNGYSTASTVKTLTVTVPSEAVFMDWDGNNGLGLGKYRANGMLDVAGDIYTAGSKIGGFSVPQNTNAPADPPSSYPLGTSTQLVNPVAGWPLGTALYGSLVTVRGYNDPSGGGTIQYWSAYQATTDIIFYRQWFYSATSWSAWSAVNSPAGQITQFAGATAPSGYLLCDGAGYSRTTYARLFGICSTAFGAGDGSTTFNVPNLKGRVPVGVDSSQTEFQTIGTLGGEKAHLLNIAEIPSHNHGFGAGAAFANYVASGGGSGLAAGTNITTSPTTGYTGGGAAHNNLQPYLSLNHIIKY